jgi:hypothetical protein
MEMAIYGFLISAIDVDGFHLSILGCKMFKVNENCTVGS